MKSGEMQNKLVWGKSSTARLQNPQNSQNLFSFFLVEHPPNDPILLHFRLQRLNLQRMQDFRTRALKKAAWIWLMMKKLKMRWQPGKRTMMLKEGRKQEQAHAGPSVTSAGKRLKLKSKFNLII